jgi:hypothetical protein
MREILPGLFHWTAVHPEIQIEVSSYYVVQAATLLDPLIPAEGLDWFRDREPPRHVILTNRLHYRHSREFAAAFGCEIRTNAVGIDHFSPDQRVHGFRIGQRLPGDIETHEVGALCPDETALRIPMEGGVLAIADGVIRHGDGPLTFVPDVLLGDDPEAIKQALKAAYARLLELEFDHILFAHGDPMIGGGSSTLRGFVER